MAIDSELFCLLNANGINVDHIPGGGESDMTREAVLLAMQGSSPAETALAMYMAGDESSRHALFAGLFRAGIESEYYEEYSKRNPHTLDLMTRLAIYEFTHQPHCKQCNGTGVDEKYQPCQSCAGTGTKQISIRKKAGVFKKTHKSWYQFRDMYYDLIKILQTWESRNESKLKRRLR